MKDTNQALGRWGEQKAAAFLEKHGYRIIERNFRTPYGEIDIIAQRDSVYVFVEVKTRRSTSFGLPEEAITQRKRTHILASAQAYLQKKADLNSDWRIDVIAVQTEANQPKITHFENAITG